MDRPATLIAAIVGVAIILVALPFTLAAFPQTPKSYDASWGERALDSKSLTVPAETGTYTATVSARDFQPASIQVETPAAACNDVHNAQLQQPAATLTVKLSETRPGATHVLRQTPAFPCSEAGTTGTFSVSLGSHSDIASAQALGPETARRIVWLDAAADNATAATYTLEVTASRPASTLPTLPGTPVTATSLTAVVHLTLNGWDVAMNEHQKEVGK